MKILIIEDSKVLSNYLHKFLTREGHTVDLAKDGANGLWMAESFRYDVILIDVMLPEINGLEVLRRLREGRSQVHVMLLTALRSKSDILNGLNSGADDYMVKPFDLDELLARINALGRRSLHKKDPEVVAGPLRFNTLTNEIYVNSKLLELPRREFTILAYLITHANELVTRSQIEEQIYDMNRTVMSNSVNSAISVIRKQLGELYSEPLLETKRGAGYILNTENTL